MEREISLTKHQDLGEGRVRMLKCAETFHYEVLHESLDRNPFVQSKSWHAP
jgi:hypothetical protein